MLWRGSVMWWSFLQRGRRQATGSSRLLRDLKGDALQLEKDGAEMHPERASHFGRISEGRRLGHEMSVLRQLHLDGMDAKSRIAVPTSCPTALEAAVADPAIAKGGGTYLSRGLLDRERAASAIIRADVEVRQL